MVFRFYGIPFFNFFLFRTNGNKEHLNERGLRHNYDYSFENATLNVN